MALCLLSGDCALALQDERTRNRSVLRFKDPAALVCQMQKARAIHLGSGLGGIGPCVREGLRKFDGTSDFAKKMTS